MDGTESRCSDHGDDERTFVFLQRITLFCCYIVLTPIPGSFIATMFFLYYDASVWAPSE